MPVFYVDALAIVKRYRTEQGTEAVEAILQRPAADDLFYTSFLSVLFPIASSMTSRFYLAAS